MEKVKVSKEQQVKDYNTVAKFLMLGNKKEVKEFAKQLNWEKFTKDCCQFMDIEFIRKYKDCIDWEIYCQLNLSEDFLKEFADYIDWAIYTEHNCELWDIEFIRKYKDCIDWDFIWMFRECSENFIREFADDYGDWSLISENQTLSEDFIREFADDVDWESLINRYNFSEEFEEEFQQYLEEVE